MLAARASALFHRLSARPDPERTCQCRPFDRDLPDSLRLTTAVTFPAEVAICLRRSYHRRGDGQALSRHQGGQWAASGVRRAEQARACRRAPRPGDPRAYVRVWRALAEVEAVLGVSMCAGGTLRTWGSTTVSSMVCRPRRCPALGRFFRAVREGRRGIGPGVGNAARQPGSPDDGAPSRLATPAGPTRRPRWPERPLRPAHRAPWRSFPFPARAAGPETPRTRIWIV
jgi:hypothetical protein